MSAKVRFTVVFPSWFHALNLFPFARRGGVYSDHWEIRELS